MGKIIARHQVQSKESYNVIIGKGILDEVVNSRTYKSADCVVIAVSRNVLALHKERIESVFDPKKNIYIEIDDGESSKTFSNVEPFLTKLLSAGLSRKSAIIAIGGGVVGDFVGFASAIYMRGIPVIHVPTTLLAIVDSSIGGKTAVNIGTGKNISGVFYPPSLVVSDIEFLSTLPDNEFRNGLSESVKSAVIGEKDLMTLLESHTYDELRTDDVAGKIASLASGLKVGVVSRDEKENGERAILNFGHTIGHAIESATEYGVSHGEAVAIGMEIIADLCVTLKMMSANDAERIISLVKKFDLAPKRTLPKTEKVMQHMKYDKKNEFGKVKFVLLEGLFRPIYGVSVDAKLVLEAIQKYAGR